MMKYTYEGDVRNITVDLIGSFVDSVKDGSLKPKFKSASVPETQGNVVVVVGTEFEKIVLDPTKDVFVMYYAPWCENSKKLAPIWDKLGEAYKDLSVWCLARCFGSLQPIFTVQLQVHAAFCVRRLGQCRQFVSGVNPLW